MFSALFRERCLPTKARATRALAATNGTTATSRARPAPWPPRRFRSAPRARAAPRAPRLRAVPRPRPHSPCALRPRPRASPCPVRLTHPVALARRGCASDAAAPLGASCVLVATAALGSDGCVAPLGRSCAARLGLRRCAACAPAALSRACCQIHSLPRAEPAFLRSPGLAPSPRAARRAAAAPRASKHGYERMEGALTAGGLNFAIVRRPKRLAAHALRPKPSSAVNVAADASSPALSALHRRRSSAASTTSSRARSWRALSPPSTATARPQLSANCLARWPASDPPASPFLIRR